MGKYKMASKDRVVRVLFQGRPATQAFACID